MSELRAIVDGYTQRNERSQSWVARQMGVSPATISSWWHRGYKRLPAPENLRALARVVGVPYRYVLDAALTDAGYLPEAFIKQDDDLVTDGVILSTEPGRARTAHGR